MCGPPGRAGGAQLGSSSVGNQLRASGDESSAPPNVSIHAIILVGIANQIELLATGPPPPPPRRGDSRPVPWSTYTYDFLLAIQKSYEVSLPIS